MAFSNVIIRPANIDDARAVLSLCSKARLKAYAGLIPDSRYADFKATTAMSDANIDWWRAKIQKSVADSAKRIANVATVNGAVVGFYGASVKGDTLHITNLYVDPQHQGQGIGSRLLKDGLGANNYQQATLHVLADNQASVEFYIKQGFAVDSVSDTTFYGAKRYKMVLNKDTQAKA